jgi:7,8-dihydropterin-6-yl-methyl-4-(beta-D-ribofuranosyl)aminobenzene 5'-phosphate synthase
MATLRILVDNQSTRADLPFEHGWSVWVDLGPHGAWLWDTGQTGLFVANAEACGIDVGRAAGLALSHGHHDHAGGLPALLAAGYSGPVVGHPGIFTRRYSRRGGATFRSIGMGDGRLPEPLPGFSPETGIRCLAPGLTFVTGIPRRPGYFEATDQLFLDTAGREPDPIADDACLVIDGPSGHTLLLGCCHAGLANTLAHLREALGIKTLATVIGGLHLSGAPETALAETAAALTAFQVRAVHPGHCTGEAGVQALRSLFTGSIIPTGCGQTLATSP